MQYIPAELFPVSRIDPILRFHLDRYVEDPDRISAEQLCYPHQPAGKVFQTASAVPVQNFAAYKGTLRCDSTILPPGHRSVSTQNPGHMRPMSVIIIILPFIRHKIPEDRDPPPQIRVRCHSAVQNRHTDAPACVGRRLAVVTANHSAYSVHFHSLCDHPQYLPENALPDDHVCIFTLIYDGNALKYTKRGSSFREAPSACKALFISYRRERAQTHRAE